MEPSWWLVFLGFAPSRFVPALCSRLCMPLLAAGCSSLPSDGPSAMAITSERVETSLPIALRHRATRRTGRPHHRPLAAAPSPTASRSAPARRGQPLGIGDVIDIRIMEAGDNGLFANTQTRGAQFQAQIDETGNIFVPYVGRMRAGRTTEVLREAIQTALADKAIQPQVLLGVVGNQANAAVVVGDVEARQVSAQCRRNQAARHGRAGRRFALHHLRRRSR
jgi:polysaccharide export outer membrane protein